MRIFVTALILLAMPAMAQVTQNKNPPPPADPDAVLSDTHNNTTATQQPQSGEPPPATQRQAIETMVEDPETKAADVGLVPPGQKVPLSKISE